VHTYLQNIKFTLILTFGLLLPRNSALLNNDATICTETFQQFHKDVRCFNEVLQVGSAMQKNMPLLLYNIEISFTENQSGKIVNMARNWYCDHISFRGENNDKIAGARPNFLQNYKYRTTIPNFIQLKWFRTKEILGRNNLQLSFDTT
jgi:hypothetical protein